DRAADRPHRTRPPLDPQRDHLRSAVVTHPLDRALCEPLAADPILHSGLRCLVRDRSLYNRPMRSRAARFVREQVAPAVDEWEQAGRFPRAVVAESGLTGLFSPRAFGGLELGYPDGMGVFEELGRGDAALAFALSMHNAVAAA